MKLYTSPQTRGTRAVWTLEEAGATYEYHKISLRKGEGRQPPYIELNPSGKVPTLVDGDLVLSESAAICLYIAEKFPEANLIAPAGTPERALVYQWCFFAIGELEQPLWTLAKHKFAIPEDKRVPAIYETAMWEYSVAANVLSQRLGDKPFLLGDTFTVADVMVGHTLRWATVAKAPMDQENIQAYMKRVFERPALACANEREAS